MITVKLIKNGVLSKTYTAPGGNVQGSPHGANMVVDVKLEGAVIEYGHSKGFTPCGPGLLVSGQSPFAGVRLHTGNVEPLKPKVGDLVAVIDPATSIHGTPNKIGTVSDYSLEVVGGKKMPRVVYMVVGVDGASERWLLCNLRLIQRDGKTFNFQEYSE